MSLKDRLADQIMLSGPITVADFMARCLLDPQDGYYATRPAHRAILGEGGDFITAPLVSQMFGELIGLWAVEVWTRLGSPDHFRLVEVGPGDGTLMVDALRAARIRPAFLNACELVMIEPSKPLRAVQAKQLDHIDLDPRWGSSLADIATDAPLILIANEVLDCLPARQFQKTEDGWAERRVGLNDVGDLAFGLAPPSAGFRKPDYPVLTGQIIEISQVQEAFAADLARLVTASRGAALLIDYGRDKPGPGDTLQALYKHTHVDPLETAGEADLTQWADFPAVMEAAVRAGADVTGCIGQGALLRNLGIQARAEALKASRPASADIIDRQLDRLTAPNKMGDLFKACAIFSPPSLAVPGFEA